MAEQPRRYGDPQTLTQFRELQRRLASQEHGILATPSTLDTAHHLLAAVETMQLGVTIADASGVVLYSNPAQARIYGVESPDEIIGKDVGVFCLPGYRDQLTPERLGEMKSWRRESVNVRKDGSVFPVLLLSDVIRGADGEPVGVITTCEDLTEVKLAEAERNRLQLQVRHSYTLENLGALASDLAGEFKEMLAIVARHTGPFLEDLPMDGERVGRQIGKVDAAVNRMAVLTEELLAYSGRGGMPPLDLTGHLRGMLRPLEASVGRTVSFRYEFLAELPAIKADPTDIDHVVRQLVANASEAFEGGPGRIGVRTEVRYLDQAELEQCQVRGDSEPGSYVLLEVSDDGPGMDPETASKIFEPVFSTRSPSGGLGLAATAAIVRRHGGAICLSTDPGEGTRFRVFFPVSPRTATAEPSTPKLAILENVDQKGVTSRKQ